MFQLIKVPLILSIPDQIDNLIFQWKTAGSHFRKYLFPIQLDLKNTAAGFNQPFLDLKMGFDLIYQTGSSGKIVSFTAVFNFNFHLSPLCPC